MADHEEAPGVETEVPPGSEGGADSVLGKRNLEEEAVAAPAAGAPPGLEAEQAPAAESAPGPDIQEAQKRAAEIAARITGGDPNKRPRTEGEEGANGNHAEGARQTGFSDAPAGYTPAPTGFSDAPPGSTPYQPPAAQQSNSFGESTRKVQIPNLKVGLVIGKGGDTIKQLQYQSGARIQVTRDQDTPPGAQYREIEVVGSEDAISKAEQLINDIVNDVGGPGRALAAPGPDAVTISVPNDKVGLIIGKGGETIKNLQNRSGARIQVQSDATLEPGATERTVTLSGGPQATAEAKRLINEVVSGERPPPQRRFDDYGGRGGYRSGPPGGQWGGPQGGYRPPGGPPPYGYSAPAAPAPYYGAPPAYPPQQYPGYDQSGYGYPPPAYGAAPAAPAAAPAYDYSAYQQPAAAAGGYDYSQQYAGYGQQAGYYQAPADPNAQAYYQQPAADGTAAAPAATYDYSQGGAAPAAAPTQ